MTDMKQCDRCGAIHSPKESRKVMLEGEPFVSTYGGTAKTDTIYDLCLACCEAFKMWLEGHAPTTGRNVSSGKRPDIILLDDST